MKIQEAKNTTVYSYTGNEEFTIAHAREILLNQEGLDIVGEHMGKDEVLQTLADNYAANFIETSLYDYVMENREETTSPRGIEAKIQIRQNLDNDMFEVFEWGKSGQFPRVIDEFYTLEEAEEFQFATEYRIMKEELPEPFTEKEMKDVCMEWAHDVFNALKPII